MFWIIWVYGGICEFEYVNEWRCEFIIEYVVFFIIFVGGFLRLNFWFFRKGERERDSKFFFYGISWVN